MTTARTNGLPAVDCRPEPQNHQRDIILRKPGDICGLALGTAALVCFAFPRIFPIVASWT